MSSPAAIFNKDVEISGNSDLIIKSGGKLGIGVTNPSTQLDVIGDVSFSGSLNGDGSNLTGAASNFTVEKAKHIDTTGHSDANNAVPYINNSGNTILNSNLLKFDGKNIIVKDNDGSASIGLTINDGGGNANLAFNHVNKIPDKNGNAGRIECNVDSNSGTALMHFELKPAVDADISVNLDNLLTLKHDGTNKRVGIGGTTNPSKTLDVNGDGKFSGNLDVGGSINSGTWNGSNIAQSKITNLTSNLNDKQATIIGAASTITSSNLTVNKVLISNSSGKVVVSPNITTTKLEYLNNVTSNIQTQLDSKVNNTGTETPQFTRLGLGTAVDSNFGLNTNKPIRIRSNPFNDANSNGPERGVLVLHSSAGLGSDTEGGNSNFSIEPSGNILTLSRAGGSSVSFPLGCILNLSRWEDSGSNSRSRLAFRLNHVGVSGDYESDYNTAMVICSNNSVGIGVTNPSTEFDVDGSGNFSGNLDIGGNAIIGSGVNKITPAGVGNPSIQCASIVLHNNSVSDQMYIRRDSNATYQIQVGNNNGNLHLQPYGGNIGIGKTNPALELDVSGSIKISGNQQQLLTNIIRNSYDGSTFIENLHDHIFIQAKNKVYINEKDGDSVMIIDCIENRVGIGKTPLTELDVSGDVSFSENLDVGGTITATTFSGSLSGNATSATTLQTAKTIGGVSFDGGSNINLPGVNTTGNQNTSGSSGSCTGNAATATKLQTARTIGGASFDGTDDIVPNKIYVAQETDSNTRYLLFTGTGTGGTNVTGNKLVRTNSNISVNPSTGTLSAKELSIINGNNKLTTSYGTRDTGNVLTSRFIELANSTWGYRIGGGLKSNNGGIFTLDSLNNGTYAERFRIDHNGNVGIGTTNPATKLDVSGGCKISGNLDVSGSLNIGSITDVESYLLNLSQDKIENGTSNVTVETSNGPISFDTNGNERMRITSSGNVGIGITNPSKKLDVNGDGNFEGNLDVGGTITGDLSGNAATATTLQTAKTIGGVSFDGTNDIDLPGVNTTGNQDISKSNLTLSSSHALNIKTMSNNAILFSTNNNEKIRIKGSGYVGIGTTDPGQKLDVNGTVNVMENLILKVSSDNHNDSTNSILFQNSGDSYNWRIGRRYLASRDISHNSSLVFSSGLDGDFTSLSDKFTITSSGNVGIGTTNPSKKLEVDGDVSFSGDLNVSGTGKFTKLGVGLPHSGGYALYTHSIKAQNNSIFENDLDVKGELETDTITISGDNMNIKTNTNHDIIFSTNNIETLRIKNNGNVGIGTDNPSEKLDVGGSGNFSSNLDVGGDLTVTGNFTVNGTTTTVDTSNLEVKDSLIELSHGTSGAPVNDAGIVIERGNQDNAFMGWDESAYKFKFGTGTFTGSSSGNLSITTIGTIVANIEGNGSELTNLNAGNISTGTLAVGRGGTGATSASNARNNLGLGTNDSVQFTRLGLGTASDSDFGLNTNGAIRIRTTPVNQASDFSSGGSNYPFSERGVLVLHSNTGVDSDTSGVKIDSGGNMLTLSRNGANAVSWSQGCILNLSRWEHDDNTQSKSRLAFRLNHDGQSTELEDNFNTAMVICSNNSVGIGKTLPSTELDVSGDISFSGSIYGDGSQLTGISSFWTGSSDICYNGGNVGIGTTNPSTKLDVTGTVKATNYIATSDRNLKENIVQINNENIIDKVTSLNGYNFNFKDDETKQTKSGLIAQEVEEFMPELISTNTDGNKSMDYNGMIPYLVECIKVQQTQIQTQQTQIQTQQTQINMLKSKIENM